MEKSLIELVTSYISNKLKKQRKRQKKLINFLKRLYHYSFIY